MQISIKKGKSLISLYYKYLILTAPRKRCPLILSPKPTHHPPPHLARLKYPVFSISGGYMRIPGPPKQAPGLREISSEWRAFPCWYSEYINLTPEWYREKVYFL